MLIIQKDLIRGAGAAKEFTSWAKAVSKALAIIIGLTILQLIVFICLDALFGGYCTFDFVRDFPV
jgi:hypothetical protein